MYIVIVYCHFLQALESVRSFDFIATIKEMIACFSIAGFGVLALFSLDWKDEDPESFP